MRGKRLASCRLQGEDPGGAAQALTAASGVNVYGYGGISTTAREKILVRGIKAGWSSVNDDIENDGVMFLLDGIPMNNLTASDGHWELNQLPIMPMFSGVQVVYGPGDPSGRWYDSLGGTVNSVPVEPKKEPGLSALLASPDPRAAGIRGVVESGLVKL